MRKAGGVIGLIASIFGFFAAILTLFIGGVAAVANANGAATVVFLGFGGVIFSFLAIITGSVAMNSRRRLPGVLLMISAVLGAIFGGTFVAVCMVLAFVGGLLSTIGGNPPASSFKTSV